jgi:hypothetical protein
MIFHFIQSVERNDVIPNSLTEPEQYFGIDSIENPAIPETGNYKQQ